VKLTSLLRRNIRLSAPANYVPRSSAPRPTPVIVVPKEPIVISLVAWPGQQLLEAAD
jgi:hypothetical protein